jgi:transcriptional regulator with XRE-family HTH domain
MRTIQELDRIVGWNIRQLRRARHFSQTRLGKALDITYQQIQKFENGQNSISAAQLAILAVVLNCSMEDFFRRDPEDCQLHQA